MLKRHTHIVWPWQWERVHWWSWSVVTHAAGRPDVIRALSAEWTCRRGRWRCRAAHSKRRKGRQCKTKPKACGWVHASQCSRLCHKVQHCIVPTVPGAQQQTQMRSTTLQPPGGVRVKRRTCYLIRQERKEKNKRLCSYSCYLFLSCCWALWWNLQCWHRQTCEVASRPGGAHRGWGDRLWGSRRRTELWGWSGCTDRTVRRTSHRAGRWFLQTATCERRGRSDRGDEGCS